MVELCKLEDKEDVELVKTLLKEFVELTGSVVAEQLLKNFEVKRKEFVKVFPYEYQRALKQKAVVEQQPANNVVQNNEPKIHDIEDSVADLAIEQKKSERALDKVRGERLFYIPIFSLTVFDDRIHEVSARDERLPSGGEKNEGLGRNL